MMNVVIRSDEAEDDEEDDEVKPPCVLEAEAELVVAGVGVGVGVCGVVVGVGVPGPIVTGVGVTVNGTGVMEAAWEGVGVAEMDGAAVGVTTELLANKMLPPVRRAAAAASEHGAVPTQRMMRQRVVSGKEAGYENVLMPVELVKTVPRVGPDA